MDLVWPAADHQHSNLTNHNHPAAPGSGTVTTLADTPYSVEGTKRWLAICPIQEP